ncbi:hypothetical protein BpHYR1_016615 [Brachionus plicatilis]|uniref:Uncharacterized protein n=1 Tax=Brachionus plicatilis TaxID=10195 RepID=A0A3M7SK70_BRAPC|nr:hypothetical protein BpHYR1_016615 [Brachionus plicatilis]
MSTTLQIIKYLSLNRNIINLQAHSQQLCRIMMSTKQLKIVRKNIKINNFVLKKVILNLNDRIQTNFTTPKIRIDFEKFCSWKNCSALTEFWYPANKFSYSVGSAMACAAFSLVFLSSSRHNLTTLDV